MIFASRELQLARILNCGKRLIGFERPGELKFAARHGEIGQFEVVGVGVYGRALKNRRQRGR